MSELNDILLFGQRCEALQDLVHIESDGGSGRVDETRMPSTHVISLLGITGLADQR